MYNHLKSIPFIVLAATALLALPVQAQEYRYSSPPAAQAVAPAAQNTQTAQVNAPAPAVAPAPAAAPCNNCGTVDTIRVVEQAGEGGAVGMIAGGLLGGLLGHQVGSGRGNTAATIIGAAGGAYAGNKVEQNVNKTSRYEVNVRMDDGSMRTINYEVEPGFRSGDKVRLVDGKLTRI